MNFVEQERQWFEAVAAVQRDGFEFGYCEDGFLLGVGSNLHFFEDPESIVQRGLKAALELLGIEAEG